MTLSKTPVQSFHDLTQINGHVSESDVAAVFDRLPPVTPASMLGKWKGGSFDTGHPTHKMLDTVAWAGKDFRSEDDVDPMMAWDSQGGRTWLSEYGNARLRNVEYRGVVSVAMIYDKFPIIDSFRWVSDNIVMGAMDNKDFKDSGTFYFYLTKLE